MPYLKNTPVNTRNYRSSKKIPNLSPSPFYERSVILEGCIFLLLVTIGIASFSFFTTQIHYLSDSTASLLKGS